MRIQGNQCPFCILKPSSISKSIFLLYFRDSFDICLIEREIYTKNWNRNTHRFIPFNKFFGFTGNSLLHLTAVSKFVFYFKIKDYDYQMWIVQLWKAHSFKYIVIKKKYSDQNNKGLDDSLNNSSNNEMVFINSVSSKYFVKYKIILNQIYNWNYILKN